MGLLFFALIHVYFFSMYHFHCKDVVCAFTKFNIAEWKKSLMYCTHTNCCWAFIPAKHIKCFRFFSVLLCFCYCWKKRQHTWYKLHFAPSNVNHCNLLNKKYIYIPSPPKKRKTTPMNMITTQASSFSMLFLQYVCICIDFQERFECVLRIEF